MKINLVGVSPYSSKSSSPHSHNDWEIVLNIEGVGTSVIGNNEYDFHPGTIICLPPNISHSKNSNNVFKDIFIQVSDFISPTGDEVPIYMDDEEKSFETLMFLALRIFHKQDSNYMAIVNSLYETMHQLLLNWGSSKPKNEHLELFKNELINNLTNPDFQITNAIKKTPYCKDHFRRCFKKDTGITPISYLTNLRIEYAKKLLIQKRNIRMTISEVSLASGFYDSHYFSRVFKSIVGMAPQEYVLKHSQKEIY